MIQAAIFDMDGLLIDSEPFWRAAHIGALGKYDIEITEDDVRKMAGKRTDEVVRHWREEYGLNQVVDEDLEAAVVKEVITRIHINGAELPGVRRIISLLEEHSIPLAVASSSAPEIIEVVLEKLQLNQHFELAYSAKNEAHGKPHPAVFLTTARRLNIEPENCLVFEDALSGIRAAKAAKMKCIAVPEAENLNNPQFSEEADLVVSSLENINWDTISSLFTHNS